MAGPITHVIFDMDGLLLDTEGFYTVVQKAILEEYGKEFTWELKCRMMGKKAGEAAQVLVDECGLQGVLTADDFLRRREAMLHGLFPSTQLMPGAERLIRHLYAHGIPMAVATSSHTSHFGLKTQSHSALFDLMHHIVTGDDPKVANGKPHPDIFQEAAARFDPPPGAPSSVLVFEDAPLGVDAAVAASMRVVMVPDARTDPELCKAASLRLSSLCDFDPAPWGLPPFPA